MSKKLLFLTPHCTTGGLPQYLLSKIELLKNEYEVYCLEWSCMDDRFVTHRNKIIDILGDNFLACHENESVFRLGIERIDPDIIWIEEHFELWPNFPKSLITFVYSKKKQCTIFETTHDSEYTIDPGRTYWPHKFFWISEYHADKYKYLLQPQSVFEYSVPQHRRDLTTRNEACAKLGMDQNKKHILTIGSFSESKNQKFVVELARIMPDTMFHFVGTMLEKDKLYWEPIMNSAPSNCKFWNEQPSIELFYQACDLMIHPSVLELNPLVLYEAISWKLPVLCNRLKTYCKKWDDHPGVFYIISNNTSDYDYSKIEKLVSYIIGK